MATDGMDGRCVLVTGGGSGIGEACAVRFAEQGAAVVVVDRNTEGAQRVRDRITRSGGVATAFTAEVTDYEQCEAAVACAVETFGGLHYAANIAGISGPILPIDEFPLEDWREVLSVNLDGVFYSMRAELRHMLTQGGGVIVNMGSIFSVASRAAYPAYTAAKHGVLGLTRSAAIDYATRGVRVNAVGPAVIDTPLLEANADEETKKVLKAFTPADRFGAPIEVANLVVWLCSDDASFVNGGFYPVDGGFTAW